MDTMQHVQARPGLKGMRRKSLDLTQPSLVRTQTMAPGQRLPLVIQPATDNVNLADWASANREFLETSLFEHGGILFRGFDLATAADFENVARSIYSSLYADYGDLPRTSAGGAIYDSTAIHVPCRAGQTQARNGADPRVRLRTSDLSSLPAALREAEVERVLVQECRRQIAAHT